MRSTRSFRSPLDEFPHHKYSPSRALLSDKVVTPLHHSVWDIHERPDIRDRMLPGQRQNRHRTARSEVNVAVPAVSTQGGHVST